jgi:polysaccharide export outer membrane protein
VNLFQEHIFMRLRLLKRLPWELPVALLLAGSISNFAQEIASGKASANPKDPANPELKVAGVAGSSYRIGVGDVLHVSVWEEPQFTEAAVVRPDGMISIPLVSEVVVEGLTPGSAETVLTARLEKFVHKPRVTVVVQEIHSRMVYITGEVQRPGAYPLIDTMNVVQLVSRSGGLTDFAKSKQVYVLRAGSGAKIKVDYRKLLKGQSPEKNLELVPGDTVVVP